MPAVGDTIDRYVIESVLGEGGMGRVYRALDPRLGRRVALKVLLTEGRSEQERAAAAARMLREARSVAAFSHPNVVAIHDVGEVDGNPFLAMEVVTGDTLRAYVGDPNLTDAHKLEWLIAVARGLGAAHRAGLVHRDIKPENVMVTTDGVVKILDFGIARRAEEPVSAEAAVATVPTHLPSLTGEGMMIGTPQYMAPEQLQGERVDGRADQFAWGVLAWELFVGTLPWGATKSGAQLVAAVLASPVRPLRDASPSVEPTVSDVVARALAKTRDARFATMEELLVALEGKKLRAPAPSSNDVALQATAQQGSEPQLPRGAETAETAALPVVIGPPPMTTGAAAVSSRGIDPKPARSPASLLEPQAVTGAGGPEAKRPPALARRTVGIGVAVALAAVGGLAWNAVRHAPTAPPAASAAAPTRGSVVGAEDQARMTRAEHEEREGRRDLACKDYRSVADANPADPRSAFETALSCGLFSGRGGGPTLARPYYHRAWDQRASLAPVDVAILDALEPILLRDPWDQKEALNRLKLLTRDFPDDARAHTLLARALSWFNDSKGEFDELARSLALDPNQPHTLYFEADHLAYNGEFDRARAAIARCLRLAATSLECLREEARIDGELGSCDHVEADARQMLAVEASSADAEQILANALYAQGSGLPALREVLARKRESMPVDERAESERADEVRLAVLSGDLSKADGLAQAASEAVAASAFASDHGAAARRVVMIEEELGRSSEAAKAASKYLEGRDGWQADTTFEDCLVSRTCG